ncbi:Tim44 domain-containing protein [Piscinibacter sakaiensis]|uniref:Mitochondrial import inner membrane translocase, subunit Tim44 n=1 Tax=Piscinibacter sakaiensis TaxID=1547922 RepID=A0A0K8NY60_PISS1|nr:TIM44-like domain-containing protein [Piscinibacter sakaiensis]GAP35342.1 mitochondrial import inner membrane translocase, subunit Tim44 precursor [Piscinibacter sakaiensis]
MNLPNPSRWARALLSAASTFALVLTTSVAVLTPVEAEAKRLGGGRSQGMQRNLPAQNTPQRTPDAPQNPAPSTPPTQAAAPMAGAAAAAAPKRSWMGPIAGLAAGLGIAALMSHLGLSEAFGQFLLIALLAVVAIVVVRLLMRRFAGGGAARGGMGGLQPAGATAGTGYGSPTVERQDAPMARSAFAPAAGAGQAGLAPVGPSVPSDFDREGFERLAKMIFIRLQAANDAGDLNDLRQFTTPEFFAAVRLDLQERGASAQQTDVVQIDAEVLDVASEAERQVVSVRFKGLVREASDAAATDFDEVWHLVKPADDSRGWAIAGIQQR